MRSEREAILSEPRTAPDPTPVPSSKQPDPTGVRLSDLNAVKQQILTRSAVTLTGIGLTAAAAGTIGQLMPKFFTASTD
jgi:hypothetical protein